MPSPASSKALAFSEVSALSPTPTRNELINDQWPIRSIGPVAAPRESMSAAAATVPTLPLLTPNQAHAVAALQTVRRLARKWGGDAKKKATEEKAAQRAAMMAAKKAVAEAAALARAPGSLAPGLSALGVASRRAMEGYALSDEEMELLRRAAAGAAGAAWCAMEGYALYSDELKYLRQAVRDQSKAPAPSPVKRGSSERRSPTRRGASNKRIPVVVSIANKPASKPAAQGGGGHRARDGSYSSRSAVGSSGSGAAAAGSFSARASSSNAHGSRGGGGDGSFRAPGGGGIDGSDDWNGGDVSDGGGVSDGGAGGEAYVVSWEDAGVAARLAIQAAVAAAQGSQRQARGAAAAAESASRSAAAARHEAQQAVQVAIGLTSPNREVWLSSLSPRLALGREEEESQRGGSRSPRVSAPATPRQASAASPRRPSYAVPATAEAQGSASAFMQNGDVQ